MFIVACGMPVGAIFISDRKTCRQCEGSLQVHGKPHVVVVCHSEFGTNLGSRMMKKCRKCTIYEHYGYWTCKGERFLMSVV